MAGRNFYAMALDREKKPLEQIDERLARKVGKIISHIGAEKLQQLGKTRRQWREQAAQLLTQPKTSVLAGTV